MSYYTPILEVVNGEEPVYENSEKLATLTGATRTVEVVGGGHYVEFPFEEPPGWVPLAIGDNHEYADALEEIASKLPDGYRVVYLFDQSQYQLEEYVSE